MHRATGVIREGGLVIVATETFYALAVDAFDEQAVASVFDVKARSRDKPLPLIAADRNVVASIIRTHDGRVQALMDRFWPGSLTILLEPAQNFSGLLTGEEGKIAVRIPPRCAARNLAGFAHGLVTATSANLTGDPPPNELAAVSLSIKESVGAVLDTGPSPGGRPSTVVNPQPAHLEIIREGAIPGELLQDFYKKCLKYKGPRCSLN